MRLDTKIWIGGISIYASILTYVGVTSGHTIAYTVGQTLGGLTPMILSWIGFVSVQRYLKRRSKK